MPATPEALRIDLDALRERERAMKAEFIRDLREREKAAKAEVLRRFGSRGTLGDLSRKQRRLSSTPPSEVTRAVSGWRRTTAAIFVGAMRSSGSGPILTLASDRRVLLWG
jgi:hypothetical protein